MTDSSPDVLDEVERLIAALEAHPDAQVREQVTQLLEGIDTVHRTALHHLVNAIRGIAGEAFVNRLIADPAIRLLFMSYDLIVVDRRILAEEALDAVRGHLHTHGIDVELRGVVGGVVYVRLHGLAESAVSEESALRDVTEALRAGLVGFQELVQGDPHTGADPGGLVQLGAATRVQKPVYRRALDQADLPPGRVRALEIAEQPILVANLDGEIVALRNRCGESPLPLEYGVLSGAEIRCPWHGCRYDLRTGKRLDTDGDDPTTRLRVFPVAVQDGQIRIAVGIEPVRTG